MYILNWYDKEGSEYYQLKNGHDKHFRILRGNGTPPLFEVLPFEINNEDYFLLIGFICTISVFENFLPSSVG